MEQAVNEFFFFNAREGNWNELLCQSFMWILMNFMANIFYACFYHVCIYYFQKIRPCESTI